MKVTMQVVFEPKEVLEAMEDIYRDKFGFPCEGFEIVSSIDYSNNVTVETVESKKDEPTEATPIPASSPSVPASLTAPPPASPAATEDLPF